MRCKLKLILLNAEDKALELERLKFICAGADVAMSPQMPPLRRILVWTVLILFLAIIFT
ncbi:MAG: hypothetical protein IJ667_05810 [Synergistaceae bacterium]|nr:hypothetical protein [Synergistaceae bacterium]